MSDSVLSLGLTPAVQRTMVFKKFELGEVNRAVESYQSSAGKAVNTATALATLGSTAIATGFNGGASGRFLEEYVKAQGALTSFTAMDQVTRTCTTVVDTAAGVITELVEEGPDPGSSAVREFARSNGALVADTRLLAISGTLPPYVKDDSYVSFAEAATAAGVPIVIDSHRDALLNVLTAQPLLAKLTVRELERTFAVTCDDDDTILENARRLCKVGAQWVMVTHGGRPALLCGVDEAVWFDLPEIKVKNPIGSGDSTTAGFIHELLDGGGDVVTATVFGLGCGMANALTWLPAQFEKGEAQRLAELVKVRRV